MKSCFGGGGGECPNLLGAKNGLIFRGQRCCWILRRVLWWWHKPAPCEPLVFCYSRKCFFPLMLSEFETRYFRWSVFIHPVTNNSFMVYSLHLHMTVLALISTDKSSHCSTARKKILVAHASCIQVRLHPLHNLLSLWFQWKIECLHYELRTESFVHVFSCE